MSKDKTNNERFLVAYPEVMVEHEFKESTLQRSTLAVRLVGTSEDGNAVFVVSEALCHVNDPFDKKKGRLIACGRAMHVDNAESSLFTLAEAKTLVEYDGLAEAASAVVSPITGMPLPYGIVNRLECLIPR